MTELRLRSGHAALDEILNGGLPGNGISILMGLPGAGKTILAQQYTFANADADRPVLYFTTMSEPLDKIVRFAQSMDFFDPAAIGTSVFYEDLGRTASDQGLGQVADKVMTVLKQRRPGLVVVDGFRALRAFSDGDAGYRRFLYQVAGRLSAFPAASLWVGVYEPHDVPLLPEFGVADAIVDLSVTRVGQRDMRYLQVRKLRGSSFQSGQHGYRIETAGLHVFPRLAERPVADPGEEVSAERVPFGIPALDAMLHGGLYAGTSTMIAGPAGSGKTVLGLHFMKAGIARGEAGVIATLQENPVQMNRLLGSFGWQFPGSSLELMHRAPIDIYLDEWVYELLEAVERTGAKRVMIDSFSDLQAASADETRFREFMYTLTQRLSRLGCCLLMTFEVPELIGMPVLSPFATSHLADNVILLSFDASGEGTLRRALTVMKTRACGHDHAVREFEISPDGIVIGGDAMGPGATA